MTFRRMLPCLLALLLFAAQGQAREFVLRGRDARSPICRVRVSLTAGERPVAHTALALLERDVQAVLGARLVCVGAADTADIIAGSAAHLSAGLLTPAEADTLAAHREGFLLKTLHGGQLLVAGADSHGVAYGLLQLSRLMGVSPWEWWADTTPEPRDSFALPAGYHDFQAPRVAYRGIFINDEDWGLLPWSSLTHDPYADYKPRHGRVGAKTSERIFELLLRLRANTYWPAMHECTLPFFLTDGNREAAEKYGIYIGGSHCEPMASSTAGEWPRRGKGDYDYVHNADAVRKFWQERLGEVAAQEILYTIGMRGVHDGAMQGAKTVDEQKAVLTRVLADQREMLAQALHKDATDIPQVFVPYKEVLDVYKAGLDVPDDVALMWCDDNYGYIRHFPTPAERARRGGNAIYYHVSYWGRPHDYLWLGTFSPGLLFQQMQEAWERGIQKIWILNVGDIKPAEYQTELFMDMAWDIDAVRRRTVEHHLSDFLCRELGPAAATRIAPVMRLHYRLAEVCRPEFLSGERVEESDPQWKLPHELPWTDAECRARLAAYADLAQEAADESDVPAARRDTYFQLVEYPVRAAALQNEKWLTAQLARHTGRAGVSPALTGRAGVSPAHIDIGIDAGETPALPAILWQRSAAAHDSIAALTKRYNAQCGGKWRHMMDCKPRDLGVFQRVTPETRYAGLTGGGGFLAADCLGAQASACDTILGGKKAAAPGQLGPWRAADAQGDITHHQMLGYTGGAATIREGGAARFAFSYNSPASQTSQPSHKRHLRGRDARSPSEAVITLAFVPTHPVADSLRVVVELDGTASAPVSYQTAGRSDEWKDNVLRSRALRTVCLPIGPGERHTLVVRALDAGVVLDEVSLRVQ